MTTVMLDLSIVIPVKDEEKILVELIPFRVVDSREQDHRLSLKSYLPAQEPEISIWRSILQGFQTPSTNWA
jgi:hypothetical protein